MSNRNCFADINEYILRAIGIDIDMHGDLIDQDFGLHIISNGVFLSLKEDSCRELYEPHLNELQLINLFKYQIKKLMILEELPSVSTYFELYKDSNIQISIRNLDEVVCESSFHRNIFDSYVEIILLLGNINETTISALIYNK